MEEETHCAICFTEYGEQSDGSFLCKDSVQNSENEDNNPCMHYFCVRCWQTIHNQYKEVICCPICRSDVSDWFLSIIMIGIRIYELCIVYLVIIVK